ncbi:MAG: hypothetical protein GIX02_13345 [Candidatus Eremiobacteraeota bacterium]|nr:hypothetical protein [Candidatus Eremiobacteraeota bacterium]
MFSSLSETELYQRATHDQAALDLSALGVDRPYWRLRRAYDLIHAWHKDRMAELRRELCELVFYIRVSASAAQRRVVIADATDVADAVEWFRANFTRSSQKGVA